MGVEKERNYKVKKKTTEYILGFITGVSIMFAILSCTNPLQATNTELGSSEWNPLYVKIVE